MFDSMQPSTTKMSDVGGKTRGAYGSEKGRHNIICTETEKVNSHKVVAVVTIR
jgi:hypothetical protein